MKESARTSPSDRRTTAKEVAEAAGVSISAVSRTFTKGASVSPATREKVLAATPQLGYQPNLLARALMTKRTELIGLISNNFDNPAFMEIFDLFTCQLQQRGRRPLLVNLSGGMESAAALDLLLQYNVDGVIIASSTLPRAIRGSLRRSAPAGGPGIRTARCDCARPCRRRRQRPRRPFRGRLLSRAGISQACLPWRPEHRDLDPGQTAGIPPVPEASRPRARRASCMARAIPTRRAPSRCGLLADRISTRSSAATTSCHGGNRRLPEPAWGSRKTSVSSASTISRWPPGRPTADDDSPAHPRHHRQVGRPGARCGRRTGSTDRGPALSLRARHPRNAPRDERGGLTEDQITRDPRFDYGPRPDAAL